jgi:hypothetical protein
MLPDHPLLLLFHGTCHIMLQFITLSFHQPTGPFWQGPFAGLLEPSMEWKQYIFANE